METAQKRMALIGAIDPLTPDFEDVAHHIRRLDESEIARRYDDLKRIDAEGTDYEVVIAGEDQHFIMT